MEQISTWLGQHQINVTGIVATIATIALLLDASIVIVPLNRMLQHQ